MSPARELCPFDKCDVVDLRDYTINAYDYDHARSMPEKDHQPIDHIYWIFALSPQLA